MAAGVPRRLAVARGTAPDLPAHRARDRTHVRLRPELDAVRIGFVRKKAPIADAPGMHACEIEIERGKVIPVVCAAEHPVEVGWGVPVATAGTTLPIDRRVKAESFHGVPSQGMICLDAELGLLPRDSGMFHFTDESLLGKPLTSVIDVAEYLVELNVLPNRPDFLGIIGIAREVAAVLGCKLASPAHDLPQRPRRQDRRCPSRSPSRSSARATWAASVQGVKIARSPDWFRYRLKLAGIEPINNVVDVTNYVMYECGQPLHAFDYDALRGKRIVVRRMRRGESLELLTKAVVADGWFQKRLDGCRAARPAAAGDRRRRTPGRAGGRDGRRRHAHHRRHRQRHARSGALRPREHSPHGEAGAARRRRPRHGFVVPIRARHRSEHDARAGRRPGAEAHRRRGRR